MKITVILLKIQESMINLMSCSKFSTNLYVVCSNEINCNNCFLLNKKFKHDLLRVKSINENQCNILFSKIL